MPDEYVRTRLASLDQYLNDLRAAQAPSLDAYANDKMLRRYTERMLHMIIDTCLAIGIAILTDRGFREPENYHDVFMVLGEQQVLRIALVSCLTDAVEFRNLLVYEHAAIDDAAVYGFARRHLDDLQAFADAVRQYAA
jgi:uncharacterized protein YutE (UPF0331/DUF86 family)